jgi:hypothetical protein
MDGLYQVVMVGLGYGNGFQCHRSDELIAGDVLARHRKLVQAIVRQITNKLGTVELIS